MLDKLARLLIELDKRKEKDFNGLGLIVYRDLNKLPISDFHEDSSLYLPRKGFEEVVENLILLSSSKSPYHDGFHLLSKELTLTGVSKYFATPIVNGLNIKNNYGSRYRTALYGSFVDGVVCTAVLSKNYGPFIFDKGVEVNPYDLLKKID
ncbi:hypothetical protein ABS768_06350 [Flavobacterium sp. ST-75]|uniref:RES domain-containing protein n=1 Tax=Flavobacterium rhizophilum TaxID=3163296 RepID=A0ABW8YAS1_9FLAO